MPVRSTHERRQASRGGLGRSDGSGRALRAAGEELGSWSQLLREMSRRGRRLSKRQAHCSGYGRRTARGTQAARVRGVVICSAGVVMHRVCLRSRMTMARMVVTMMTRRHCCGVRVGPGGRAQHGRSHRTPNREREGQNDEEPNAD